MISDFWLGFLAMGTIALAIFGTVAASLIAWLVSKLSKFVDVKLSRSGDEVTGSVKVKAP